MPPRLLVNRKFESPFKIGDRIGGRYEVHRILGGGMGEVYVVYDHDDSQCPGVENLSESAG